MGKKRQSKRPGKAQHEEEDSGDWIAALAKQAATQESSAASLIPSKEERIERRNAKKQRRQERKPSTAIHTQRKRAPDEDESLNRSSAVHLKSLAQTLEHRVTTLQGMTTHRSRPYQENDVKKGKATSGNRLNDEMIQPRRRDYGGLGLARPSIFISLRDPSFVPKLEEEFAEHVPGFFGKQKTKSMKKQLDGNMLWRQLAEKRADDRKFEGKKLSEMSADERVEAMIKAGMI